MLSAISGAKQAKKDESGQNARLKRHYGVLDEATTELESLITSESALEGAVQKLHDRHRNDMKFALGNLLRKAKEVAANIVQDDSAAQRKALHEKEVYWKLKLETNRVAATSQLRNQALQMENAHNLEMKEALREQRVELLGDSSSALTAALERLEESTEEHAQLSRQRDAFEQASQRYEAEAGEARAAAEEAGKRIEELHAAAEEEAKRSAAAAAEARAEADAEAARLTAQAEASAAEAAELQAQMGPLRAEAAEAVLLRSEVEVLRSEVEAAQSESEAKARELKESEAALATAKAEGEQSEAALGTAREELAASEVYRAELRAECERLRASAAAASEAIDKAAKLELALAQVTEEAAALQLALTAEQSASTTLQERLDASQLASSEVAAKLEQCEAELDGANSRLKELEAKLAEAKPADAPADQADGQTDQHPADKVPGPSLPINEGDPERPSGETELEGLEGLEKAGGEGGEGGGDLARRLREAEAMVARLKAEMAEAEAMVARFEAEQEGTVKQVLQSLTSMRSYLVRSLTGGTQPSLLINGADPVSGLVGGDWAACSAPLKISNVHDAIRQGLSLRPSDLAAISRKRAELDKGGGRSRVGGEHTSSSPPSNRPWLPAIPQASMTGHTQGGATSRSLPEQGGPDAYHTDGAARYVSTGHHDAHSTETSPSLPHPPPHAPTRDGQAPRHAKIASSAMDHVAMDQLTRQLRKAIKKARASGDPAYKAFCTHALPEFVSFEDQRMIGNGLGSSW